MNQQAAMPQLNTTFPPNLPQNTTQNNNAPILPVPPAPRKVQFNLLNEYSDGSTQQLVDFEPKGPQRNRRKLHIDEIESTWTKADTDKTKADKDC
jgi:hypothetical protein